MGRADYQMAPDRIKANGVHYTPPALADFLASATAQHLPKGRGEIAVLDPACGSGNFLYVTMHLVKRIELEVLRELEAVTGKHEILFEEIIVGIKKLFPGRGRV
jgi:type I restriction-modification system DNA methylase subunit